MRSVAVHRAAFLLISSFGLPFGTFAGEVTECGTLAGVGRLSCRSESLPCQIEVDADSGILTYKLKNDVNVDRSLGDSPVSFEIAVDSLNDGVARATVTSPLKAAGIDEFQSLNLRTSAVCR